MSTLSVVGLTKRLPDDTVLFENLSFQLSLRFETSPSVLVVRGPSGTGKTTLLKCLAQLVPYDSGVVSLDDQQPDQLGIPRWRSLIQYVPQRPPVFPGTPLEFVETLSGFASQKPKRNCLDPVTIGESWDLSPSAWSKQWSELSGGEIQRVALAIAVSRQPTVLLLDEPTSALDAATCQKVEATLKSHTCIWITHDPAQEERVATASLLLERGRPSEFILHQQ
ncbi:putative ATP-binding cassette transporter [Polychytrium aggregatum]|uniref:putative ATP-binding cassette transporter n=1 Tax=Polychytrium aggregatum TaxID=110093 RepID=UPI0022FDB501|nr:putative ATP-binding cassette transporter [Polychytrium aggregatum]KAI9208676.1 putative ATP-binding cassette transporter [Polychytrium aggregatum]